MTPREKWVHGWRVARLAARHGDTLVIPSDLCCCPAIRAAARGCAPALQDRESIDRYTATRDGVRDTRRRMDRRMSLLLAARLEVARLPQYRALQREALRVIWSRERHPGIGTARGGWPVNW